MSLLNLFRKKQPATGPPPPIVSQLNTFVSPNVEGKGPYVGVGSIPPGQGGPTWAPRVGIEMPTVINQDRALVHYLQPPPDRPPGKWYAERNAHRIRDYRLDQYNANPEGWEVEQYENQEQLNPWIEKGPPTVSARHTTGLSPSGFRAVVPGRPLGLHEPRQLNGLHFSMASMHRGYPIGGMQPRRHFRNTYRVEPPPRDAQSQDITAAPTVQNATYQSPDLGFSTRGKTFRLA